jgi:putative PIG3 family NAD(P)H quinone oxidoreductase
MNAANIPKTMTAIEITEPGGPEVLRPASVDVPQPGAGEVLIKVSAAGVNRPDVIQRQGLYPPPKGASPLPGLEAAGTIAVLGEGVENLELGVEVTALLSGGGYAEYAVAPAAQCLTVPKGLTMEEAAGLPETFFTVWSNVFDRAGLQSGENFLVHGGTGGIGTTAIQMAAAFGATVFATAGSIDKCETCVSLGAARAINYHEEDFVEVLKKDTGSGADVILDMVGGEYIQRNMRAAAPDGRIVSIAFLTGSKSELDLMAMMLKRLTLTGSTLRTREIDFKAAIAAKLKENVWPLIEDGRIRPVIDSVFPLDQATNAHALMESSNHIGKIVLRV